MSAVNTLTRLVGTAAGGAVHAATHPVETLCNAAGLARDAATIAVSVVTGPPEARQKGGQEADQGTPAPTEAPAQAAPEAAAEAAPEPPIPSDGPSPEPTPPPVATEPKPSGADDDWRAELDDDLAAELDVDTDVDDAAQAQPDEDVPLIDPATAKSVRAESATLRHAAEAPKEQGDKS